MHKLILSFLSMLVPFIYFHGQSYQFKNYTVNEGLPSSEIYHVIQDRKGFIWFGTNQGVSKFDGYRFKNYDNLDGLPDNTVFEIFEDYKGRIWFVPLTGLLSYMENDSIKLYPYNEIIQNNDNKGIHPIKNSFYVDSLDNVYISFYNKHILKITARGKLSLLKPRDSSKSNKRYLVVLNKNKVLYNRQNKEGEIVISDNGEEASVKSSLKTSYDPRVIATYMKNTIFYAEGNSLVTFKKFNEEKARVFPTSIIWLSTDEDGKLWVGIYKNGVKAFVNEELDDCKLHILKDYSVSSVCKDNEGGHWFTTLEQGVFYYPSFEIKSLTKVDGLNAVKINSITSKKDVVWFGGDNSELYSFDFKSVNRLKLFNEDYISYRFIKFIGDTLVISCNKKNYNTIFRYNGNVIFRINEYFSGIRQFENGKIYLFNRWLKYFENGELKKVDTYKNNNVYFYDLFKDNKDNLWIGSEKGLLLLTQDKIIQMADSNNLFANRVQCIEKGGGNSLWLGTKGAGLLFKNNDTIVQYTTKDGLPGNSVNSIFVDNTTLWLATNKGVGKVETDSLLFNKIKVEVFSVANGLINNEVNDLEVTNGYVFAATNKGLSYFQKSLNGNNKYAPPSYITSIVINGKDTVILPKYLLKHFQNHLEIGFVGLSYKNSEPLTYSYLLQGVDNEWKTTHSQSVIYPHLPPGSYEFRLKTINNSGIESKDIQTIRFYIRKPYWKTTWFKFLIILAIIVPIVLLYSLIQYIKLKEKRKRNSIKNEMNKYRHKALSVQMNPHFIHNSLNSVQNYILKNDTEKSSDYLSKFGRLMRKILENSQEPLISLGQELDALNLYIEMELIRFRNSFEYYFELAENIDAKKIFVPPLIVQPYVENAIHHGLRTKEGDKTLKISIFTTNETIHIVIVDNGIGRDRATKIKERKKNTYKSLGTEITEKRLRLFKEIYKNKIKVITNDLFDNKNQVSGTKVELIITNGSNSVTNYGIKGNNY
jgi:ligand-binding sensor domain-containing protein